MWNSITNKIFGITQKFKKSRFISQLQSIILIFDCSQKKTKNKVCFIFLDQRFMLALQFPSNPFHVNKTAVQNFNLQCPKNVELFYAIFTPGVTKSKFFPEILIYNLGLNVCKQFENIFI